MPPLEQEARRAAINAERAYTALSTELVPPRGKVDLVVSDNVDYVNGYATPFPSNRIVVFAHPPTDASGPPNYEDWNSLVVTPELTHIFHLDRSRGIWRIGQAIFGRNPLLFPNLYQPSWVIEGLAVYFESRVTGYGRLESSEHSMIARAAALANRVPTLQSCLRAPHDSPSRWLVYGRCSSNISPHRREGEHRELSSEDPKLFRIFCLDIARRWGMCLDSGRVARLNRPRDAPPRSCTAGIRLPKRGTSPSCRAGERNSSFTRATRLGNYQARTKF